MRTDVTYMNRVGTVGIGKVQRRVLRAIAFYSSNLNEGSDLTVRMIAEFVYKKDGEKVCESCGQKNELSSKELVAVRQALKALIARGVVREAENV